MEKLVAAIMVAHAISLCSIEALGQAKSTTRCAPLLANINTYAAVYFDDHSLKELGKFDMVILDPDSYSASEIEKLKQLGTTPIAYLDIGEIETFRKYFTAEDTLMFLSPDPHWRYSYYVNICNPRWQRLILEKRIPEILDKGFCGIFADFCGSLKEYPARKRCAASLVKGIRDRIGLRDLIVDGGEAIIDKIGEDIDGIAVEGLMGRYDFDANNYRLYSERYWHRTVTFLLDKAQKYRIKIFQLDYASPSNIRNRRRIILESTQARIYSVRWHHRIG